MKQWLINVGLGTMIMGWLSIMLFIGAQSLEEGGVWFVVLFILAALSIGTFLTAIEG